MLSSEKLTLQMCLNGKWQSVAYIVLDRLSNNARLKLEYAPGYAIDHEEYDDIHAVAFNYPPALFSDSEDDRLCFLDDMTPSGPGLRYWCRRLGCNQMASAESLFRLLRCSGAMPVGHLRIKEALLSIRELNHQKQFSIDDVKSRRSEFVELAHSVGASAVSGEAPKFLVRCDQENNVWLDVQQEGFGQTDLHYLVKFPRGRCLQIDRDILRAEYHYYQELADLGYETISSPHMRLEEALDCPSLWLPRFDISSDGKRLALESIYSMLNKKAGEPLEHEQAIRAIVNKISQSFMVKHLGYQFDSSDFVIEWVRRDLLNIAFGNSDNHGRNTSLLRGKGWVRLAPIYDFAPMRADPEGITRAMRWAEPMEVQGELNAPAIAEALQDHVDGDRLILALRETAAALVGLKQRLLARGVSKQIVTMPAVGLEYLDDKLKRWGLL